MVTLLQYGDIVYCCSMVTPLTFVMSHTGLGDITAARVTSLSMQDYPTIFKECTSKTSGITRLAIPHNTAGYLWLILRFQARSKSVSVKRTRNQSHFVVWFAVS